MHAKEILHLTGAMPETVPHDGRFHITDAITVSARVDAETNRPEAMQALVSKWSPPDVWPGFAAHDASTTDGLDTTGYFGAVFDGRYVYCVPEQRGDFTTHGVVLRYDTHADFKDRASFAAYDAGMTDGLETRGYYGAVFDGRYVYFVPRQFDVRAYHSLILRLDTQGNFKDAASWSAYDIGLPHSHQSAAFDGRYIYFCPGFYGDPQKEDCHSGHVIRYDTQSAFKAPSSYAVLDITSFLGPDAACFDGGAFDGRYIYFVPLYSGIVVRYDTHGNFAAPESWQRYDARPHGYEWSVGAVFDGRHLYFCAYGHSKIIRFDTNSPFDNPASWQAHEADHTDGLRTTGFDGGFFDGRFVYFQPFFIRHAPGREGVEFHSHYLRYDSTKPFDDSGSWQALNASRTDELKSVGYNAGAFDGRYFYAAPWQQGPDGKGCITHGTVLRCDTLGDHGSFSLRYCDYGHNGGLNAAVPGPSFLINTEHGVLSVASHHCLAPGPHELIGVYDGRTIRLFVDGQSVAERSGSGRIVTNQEPISLGHIRNGMGHFSGTIREVCIWNAAVDV